MKRDNKLAVVAVLLTAVVVAVGLFTVRGLLSRTGPAKKGKGPGQTNPALKEALDAYKGGRLEAALKAARRAAQSGDAASRRSARLVEARALSGLGDPKAAGAWSAILDDAAFSANQRAEAAVWTGKSCLRSEPPDVAGAIAACRQAVEQFAGTAWGDQAAISLADAYIKDKYPERAEAALTAYVLGAKDPELIQAELCEVNMAILFSPLVTEVPKCITYTVKSGDSLAKIARKYNTSVDLLAESNRIDDPHLLQVGDRLKVVTDSFRIVIVKSDNTLSLFCHDTLLKKYRVGTGEYDKTPVGEFGIVSKNVDPPWRGIPFGDPRNVLGTRWMGISDEAKALKGYGIHGTWEPETIGTYKSQGCVRLLNEDVEQLFKIVSIGTPVRIVE